MMRFLLGPDDWLGHHPRLCLCILLALLLAFGGPLYG